jgi:hypothetical protein
MTEVPFAMADATPVFETVTAAGLLLTHSKPGRGAPDGATTGESVSVLPIATEGLGFWNERPVSAETGSVSLSVLTLRFPPPT